MKRSSGSPLIDPDRRYWRNRGNRSVRKKRRLRTLGRLTWLAIAYGVVLAIASVSIVTAWSELRGSDLLRVDRILIEGTERCDPAELEALVRDRIGAVLTDVDLDAVAERIESTSWIAEARVRRELPDTIRIDVSERTPRARLSADDATWLVDATGSVIVRASDRPEDARLPRIDGVDGLPADATDASAKTIRRAVAAHTAWRRIAPRFADRVEAIDVGRTGGMRVVLAEAPAALVVDPDRPTLNVRAYLDIEDEIRRRVDDASTVDLRWRDFVTVAPRPGS